MELRSDGGRAPVGVSLDEIEMLDRLVWKNGRL
jgi:hypothetical protein